MKVTSNQKISNLSFWYCKPKSIICFLLFFNAKWLVIVSLLSQFINLALINPVFASTNYTRRADTQIGYSRGCDTVEESQTLIAPNYCVSSYLYPVKLYNSLPPSLRQVGDISNVVSLSNKKKQKKLNSSRKSPICVGTDIKILMTELLRDLPSYANRASQRGRRLNRTTQTYTYMLMVGKPEFESLPTSPIEDIENKSKKSQDKDVKQVFFTTLERQYIKGRPIELQQFHRLFLTKADDGWQMVMMFTQTGSYPKSKPPTPPRDSSNGVVGQAIKTWLRDCRVADNKRRKS